MLEYNSSAQVAAGSATEEEESDADSSVVADLAQDISTTENQGSAAECQDGINEEASITEAEDISIAEDTVDMEGVTEEEDIAAKYQDVPADSDTSMDLADVVAVDQESREVIKNIMLL